jgi:hypothetical protein
MFSSKGELGDQNADSVEGTYETSADDPKRVSAINS